MSLDDDNIGKPVNTSIMVNGIINNAMNETIYASNPNTRTTGTPSRVKKVPVMKKNDFLWYIYLSLHDALPISF
jgi:hypothetical protein